MDDDKHDYQAFEKEEAKDWEIIREFDEARDMDTVQKLERSCDHDINGGGGGGGALSILSNNMGDPMSRINLFPIHTMLVMELAGVGGGCGEVVGAVRGCIKLVGSGGGTVNGGRFCIKMGCILGLRVSPLHRRKGIATKLVTAMEDWAARNGAHYVTAATDETNSASVGLFVDKLRYTKLGYSLEILIQPIVSDDHHRRHRHPPPPPCGVKMKKLSIEQAVSIYKHAAGDTIGFFPADIDAILSEQRSLGSWVAFFDDEDDHNDPCSFMMIDGNNKMTAPANSCWAILSLWKKNFCCSSSINDDGSTCRCSNVFPSICERLPLLRSRRRISRSFGFIFVYGIHGEGENAGELVSSLWSFAVAAAGAIKGCKAVVTELAAGDSMKKHVTRGNKLASTVSDLWFVKKLAGAGDDDVFDGETPFRRVFVDPRDF